MGNSMTCNQTALSRAACMCGQIALALAFALAIACANAHIAFAYDAGSWDGTSSEQWTQGSGSYDDPYLIESAANLAYLRDQVNNGTAANSSNLGEYAGAYFKQTVDIDLSGFAWTPIGVHANSNVARAFSGHYDGGGHTVRGLNVSLAGSSNSGGVGLFGYVKGSSSDRASIEGIVVRGSVNQTASSYGYTAGLVGYGSYVDIRNSGNDATVLSASQYAAGIIGFSQYSTVEGCFNHGSISSTYSNGGYAAGIVSMAAVSTARIADCYNTGDISSLYNAGGILGGMYGNSLSAAHAIENCFNAGTVSATSVDHSEQAGGIIGCIYSGNEQYASAQTMTNCYSLEGSAPQALIGNEVQAYMTITDSGAVSDDDMKAPGFAGTMGSAFITGATYPALAWEAPAGIPVIVESALVDAAYAKDATDVEPLSVTAEGDPAYGELVYQWYKATQPDLSDAVAAEGASTNSYTPATDTLGDFYYYCTVSNDVQTLSGSGAYEVHSNVAHIQVWTGALAVAPVITSQPSAPAGEAVQGADAGSLVVAASFGGEDETDDNSTLGYQWQVSDSADGTFSDIDGANEASMAIPTGEIGTKYYRCIVTTTRETPANTASTTSDAVPVTVRGLEIDTLEKLRAFAEAVDGGDTFEGRTVTITADITITGAWNPAGDWTINQPLVNGHYFAGELDGAGHTITFAADSATEQYFALIAATYDGAYIHDLVVDGSITSNATVVAGIVAQAAGSTTFERVGNRADVTSTGASAATVASSVGGIVGAAVKPTSYPALPAKTYAFVECYNTGAISGDGSRIGGIVGNGSDAVQLTSCYNTGDVQSTANGTSSSAGYVGGIFGGGVSPVLKNCYSTGDVSMPGLTNSQYCGALVGYSSAVNPTGDDACYYLEGASDRARGGEAAQPDGYIAKSSDEFADTAGILSLLGAGGYAKVWAADVDELNGGYPVLAWQGGGELPATEPAIVAASPLLNGAVGVRIAVSVPEDMRMGSVRFSLGDTEVSTVSVADAVETEGGAFAFDVPIAPKNLADSLTVEFVGESGESQALAWDYSSAWAFLSDPESGELANAMADYGAAARDYLVEGGVTGSCSTAVAAVSADDLNSYEQKTSTGSVAGLADAGFSLVHGSELSYKQYFRYTGDLSSLSATIDGEPAEIERAAGECFVRVPVAAASRWAEPVTVSVTDGSETYSVTFSAMAYASAKAGSQKETLVQLTRAMHLYYQAVLASS